jgi:hypothetical protein
VGVKHNGTVINVAILLEQTRNIRLGQARVNTSDEEVGARVDGTFIFLLNRLASQRSSVIRAAIGGAAASTVAVGSRLIARRGTALTIVPGLV